MNSVSAFIPLALTFPIVVGFLWLANWFLLKRHASLGNERKFPRQMIMIGLVIAGLVAIAMALPVGVSTRNQVIAFMGLVVSGIFAFSSTTVFANLMAGLMMRTTQPFRAGDFISVNGNFGRVSERGLLDTEIQTETRQLISIPNTYLIAHPVSVIRSSGAIVSVTVSLGYDVHHAKVTPLLLEAAAMNGLEEPFVHLADLGNYSISYKVSGLLTDVKSLLSARSHLNQNILDVLHREKIEIVSPNFMNQRPLAGEDLFIPEPVQTAVMQPESSPEAIIFDKAEEAERKELEQLRISKRIEQLQAQLSELVEEKRVAVEAEIEALKTRLKQIEELQDKKE